DRTGRGSDGRETGEPTTDTYAAAVCLHGEQALPVVHDVDAPDGELVQSGHVYAADHNSTALYAMMPTTQPPLPFYLAPDRPIRNKNLLIVAGIGGFLFGLGMIGKGVRDLRRARRIVA